ncbi:MULTISPECIES: M56 family metallopeptidase [unclassified Spirosoma]|uniref:M56 family metallopeptidase n=1 Tax=unclassified Spirosoma TaxID=2621999 RepID=UPI000962B8FB|nr:MULTISPECIES: M56 family metallopeptidase [unclassified Spirosoma]MBN8825998.1 M56 family metallopeptidase [Spirosoma sp.]OJW71025.1 MAG: energy transducer TonB [Spirosoma sp. 48-14]
MSPFSYFLTASLYLLLFYGCYVLLLCRNTFFGLNRVYLLLSVGLSLALPFVELPGEPLASLPTSTITLPTFEVGQSTESHYSLTLVDRISIVYALGILIMLTRLALNVWAVFRLIHSGKAQHREAYTLIRLPDDSSPSFSFGRYLVLNRSDGLAEPDALLRHEAAHIRQRHTVDILALELIQVVFWFNPVLIYYKRALQEVHEFLADRAVLKTPQPDYPQQLVAYALNVSPSALITPFVSKSTLKQRIIMLKKPVSKRRALFGYVLVLPLAACLLMCTQTEKDLPVSAARKPVKVEGEVFTVVDDHPQFPGGMKKLGEYLSENLKYPEAAEKSKIEGKVFVRFVVTDKGEITNVEVLRGIGYGADEEAVRVVEQMPNWTPARQNGKAVNVMYNLPIRFQLEEDDNSSAVNEFWNDFTKGRSLTLNNQPVSEQILRTTIQEAQLSGKHISVTINKQTNTVNFQHVDS